MTDNDGWFTERALEIGTAFSLKITDKLHSEQTPFQKLEIYQTDKFGRLMVLDGFIMLSQRDNFLYHEMMAHPPLFCHPSPENVVIIGGGDCGTLREVLKHPTVKNAWQIEIDERVTRNAETYFPELCEANDDPRARLVFDDGIAWIENTAPGSIDLVIVDSTDPIGPAAGLFQAPFYRACHAALGEAGMLVQQTESPLAHCRQIIYPVREAMREAGFLDVHTYFYPMPMYPTGWWSSTLAGKQPVNFQRQQAAHDRPFKTDYYNVDTHKGAFAQPGFFQKGECR